MKLFYQIALALSFPFLLVSQSANANDASSNKVTIYRDNWGVPHIYADTPAGGAFGLGYAQAEDRLDDVYTNIRTGLGRMSEAFGKKYVDQDYMMRLCRNEEVARDFWKKGPENYKALAAGYVAGVQAYIKKHPEKVPEFAFDLEPWMCMTVGRAMILRWPIGTIMDDLGNGKKKKRREGPPESLPMRSNEWSVAANRSAENCPILLTDPHLTWEGLAVLYESRVHSGEMQMNGFSVVGSPVVGLGHNENVGWAMTTGGPDTSDVYEIKLKNLELGKIPEYEYDGKMRKTEVSLIRIDVKGGKPVLRPSIYTHLGPVISPPDQKTGMAYVGASPYLQSDFMFDQFYKMATAKNGRELYEAIGMHQFNEQNIMFADTEGNTGYVRSGATPIRPDGYDWNAPVPGNTSKTAWKGLHPIDDLVHIFNPPQGYMQNCNISPENMMVGSTMKPGNYPDYIFNVSWDFNNPRGKRTVDLLDADSSVTKEEAIAYTMDVHDIAAEQWKQELRSALKADKKSRSRSSEFNAATKAIFNWDNQFVAKATQTVLYKNWRLECGNQIRLNPMAEGKTLNAKSKQQMLDILAKTIIDMKKKYGRWDIAWGDVHKVGRGDVYYPVDGAEFRSGNKEANFSETLFDVRCEEDPKNPGHYIANNGSMSMMLMFFHKDGIESYTCTPWGQSADPKSPHFMDQGQKLYSQRKMKPTLWKKEDLMKHVESETVLEMPTL